MTGWIIPLAAMLCIAGLVAFALSQGINGAVMSSGIALIAGIGGYKVKATLENRKKG